MQILLTGATGFVGQHLLKALAKQPDLALRVAVRIGCEQQFSQGIKVLAPFELAPETNWQDALAGVEVVIHTAARVHRMNDRAEDPLWEFRQVNTEGTLDLARQAASLGVKRFILLSSIKVNGESTPANQAFSADDQPNPKDPYAISKYEAEQGLQDLAAKTGMEVVIIRPPLIYGPGVKGNFQRLLVWLQRGIPLPLGAVKNKRSFVAIANLTNLIRVCINHPRAANQVFLVSDDEDLSTTELLRGIGQAINKPARLLPIPQGLLKWAASLLGQKAAYERLCESLRLDISKTRTLLDWEPEVSVQEALKLIDI